MKNGAEVDDHPLSREIEKACGNRQYMIFAIIFVAEMIFTLFDGIGFHDAFWRSVGFCLGLFIISYVGSLIMDREKRFKALYSIAFTLYILALVGRHKSLR